MGTNVRILFGEQGGAGKKTFARAAVVMTTSDLIELRELLIRVTKDVQTVEAERTDVNG